MQTWVCGGDVAFCQITSDTCSFLLQLVTRSRLICAVSVEILSDAAQLYEKLLLNNNK